MIWWIQLSSAALALIAAICWLKSATIALPASIQTIDFYSDGRPSDDDLGKLTSGLQKQARWSAFGALSAAASAILQVLLFLIS